MSNSIRKLKIVSYKAPKEPYFDKLYRKIAANLEYFGLYKCFALIFIGVMLAYCMTVFFTWDFYDNVYAGLMQLIIFIVLAYFVVTDGIYWLGEYLKNRRKEI